jgi:hypothetical protein
VKSCCMCSWNPSTMFSRTANRMYEPTSRCATAGDCAVWRRKGRSCGHVPTGISIVAIAAMTRAVECRTSLLKEVQNKDRAFSGMEHARRIGENEVGQRRLDLLPLVLRELQPEIAGAV